MDRRTSILMVVLAITLLAMLTLRLPFLRTPRSDEPRQYIAFTEEIMATPITVLIPEERGTDAADIVFDIFKTTDARMSEWKASSPLSAVNKSAGQHPVDVPSDLRNIIHRGIEIGDLTDGAFDLTWAALWGLWDFKAINPRVPTEDEIAQRIDLVDYRQIQIDDERGTAFLPQQGMLIGLGGIAKGYALDKSAEALRARGVTSFLISAGGQMIVSGLRVDREWRVGIRDPRGKPDDYFAFVSVTDTSISTSGDYESYFNLDGVRYHHILDPRTGRPAHGLRSATVICPDATLADALSTAMMILGKGKSLALAEQLNNVEAVLVDENAIVHVSPGIEAKLQRKHPPTP